MILSLDKSALARYVARQLEVAFPDGQPLADLGPHLDQTLDRVETCFSAVNCKYFLADGQARFDHLHSDQYAMFLYLLSNTVFRNGGDRVTCTKLFYLNKILHGIDVYYEVALPNIFLFSHSVGTVLGRASYSDYFLVNQNCTIGAAREAEPGQDAPYPVLGRYVAVYKGASVLGACHVGDNCKISAHSVLLEQDLASDQIYIGTRGNCVTKGNRSPDNIWKKSE